MNKENKITGSCLCGAVEFAATGPFLDFTYCHCGRCRKAVGSAHSAHLFADPKRFAWVSGEKETTLFLAPQAEDYPRRFCNRCGSPVPRLARDGARMAIPAGALDSDPGLRPTKNVFWSLRAPWSRCRHDLPTFALRPPKRRRPA
jgi:hypothetical protein